MGIVIVVQSQPHLLQIVFTLTAAGRLAGLLNRRQQQRYKDGDDGDHDQQFNQRKTLLTDSSHSKPFLKHDEVPY